MYCTQCGTLYTKDQNFCRNCGTDLRRPVPVETTDPANTMGAPTAEASENDKAFDSQGAIETATIPASPEPKGRWWPPYLVMAILVLLGTLLFFLADNAAPAAPSCFYIEDGTLYFDPLYYTGEEELEIPAQIDGQDVLHLAPACFSDCGSITTVILPDTLQSIGTGAFSGCESLRGIYIPKSVKSIGDQAFMGCSALEAVYLSDQVTYLGTGAFNGCSSLMHIFFSGNCESWTALYDEFIAPDTKVYADDGELLLREVQ